MPDNNALLKKVRRAAAKIAGETQNAEHMALLAGIDTALNELMQVDQPDFYRQFIADGQRLLEEGLALLPASQPSDLASLQFDDIQGAHPDQIGKTIDALNSALISVVKQLDEAISTEQKSYLKRLTDWEVSLYEHRTKSALPTQAGEGQGFSRETLQAYLEQKFPTWKNVQVTQFQPLKGGFSKKTILFETMDELNGKQPMVIRAEQDGTLLTMWDGSDVGREFYSIQVIFNAGLPAPEPLWLETDTRCLGHRFLVTKRIEGDVLGTPGGPTQPLSDEQLHSMIDWMLKMHAVKLDPQDPIVQKSHFNNWLGFKSTAEAERHFLSNAIDTAYEQKSTLTPLLLRIQRWLLDNVPDEEVEPVIVHTDFCLNNMLFDANGISAILDWETSKFGDPAEELVWTGRNLQSLISREKLVELYEERTGKKISEYRLAYYEIKKGFDVIVTIMNGLDLIQDYETTDITLCIMCYQYMYMSCQPINDLIDRAEAIKAGN